MDKVGLRQFLERVPPQDFRDSSDTMDFTDDRVRAAETPSTERWFQGVSCEYGTMKPTNYKSASNHFQSFRLQIGLAKKRVLDNFPIVTPVGG